MKYSWVTLAQTVGSIVRLRGFHPKFEFTPSELAEIPSPVLLIWGTNDPFGSIESGKMVPTTLLLRSSTKSVRVISPGLMHLSDVLN